MKTSNNLKSISSSSHLPLIRIMSFIRLIHVGEKLGISFSRFKFHFPLDGNAFVTRNRDDAKFQLPIRDREHYWWNRRAVLPRVIKKLERSLGYWRRMTF